MGQANPVANTPNYDELPSWVSQTYDAGNVNTSYRSGLIDCRAINEIWFLLENTTNQNATFSLNAAIDSSEGNNPSYEYFLIGNGSQALPSVTINAGGNAVVWGPFSVPGYCGIYTSFAAAPTSGNLQMGYATK